MFLWIHTFLKEKVLITYKYCSHKKNKFILLQRKGAYPFEYMNDWGNFNETSLPEKIRFLQSPKYGRYRWCWYPYTKSVCKDFEIKNLGKYHDLYAQSNTLLLADVFENFWDMCLEIYEFHSAKFFQLLD